MVNKNKEFHKLLGHCWHDIVETEYGDFECKKCGVEIRKRVHNPDYADDPRLVIKEMKLRKDFNVFLGHLMFMVSYDNTNKATIEFFMDTTGNLRNIAMEWLKGRKVKLKE